MKFIRSLRLLHSGTAKSLLAGGFEEQGSRFHQAHARQRLLFSARRCQIIGGRWEHYCTSPSVTVQPPIAKKKEEYIRTHGYRVEDPYRWMQDPEDKDVWKYIEEENIYTSSMMKDTSEMQEQLLDEMEDWSHLDAMSGDDFEVIGDYVYYTKSGGGEDYPVYCRSPLDSDEDDPPEEIVLDVNHLADTFGYQQARVSVLKLSPGSTHLAITVETDSADSFVGHIVKVGAQDQLVYLKTIPDIFNIEWITDDVILYTKAENLRACQVWRCVIGQADKADELLYQENDDRYFVDVSHTKDRKFVTINSNSKTTSEVRVVSSSSPMGEPCLVQGRIEGMEYYVEHHGGKFFFLTNQGAAADYKLMCAPTNTTSSSDWTEVVPPRPGGRVVDMDMFHQGCVLAEKRGGVPAITVVPTGRAEDTYSFKLPTWACVIKPGANTTADSSGYRFTLSSPIQPEVEYEFHLPTRQLWKQTTEGSPAVSDQYVMHRLMATSQDGTSVPLTVFHKKGVEQTGKNPLLVYVYGAYGEDVNMNFSSERLVLLERGWVLAFCHVRGGGELGRQWYHNGRLLNKDQTFKDLESCISHLHGAGYSSPGLTAACGTSAGGMAVAALCNRSPGLLAAAIMKVPFVDVLGAMLDRSLPLTAQEFQEWGDPGTHPDVFNYIKAYCPYHNIKPQSYPSMLVTATLDDTRVPYWSPLKYVAKLRGLQQLTSLQSSNTQERMTSTDQTKHSNDINLHRNFLILQVHEKGGHFGHDSQAVDSEQAAFEYAFLYKALGLSMT
ncbi:PREDICTED: prolyl endopeptidase-like [Branchiostoma belcheri]|uniref:Prolyl endopeptidase n=1 Tax=Branchiostoma belcheri TaxID=7741 RepID=A0A6P4YE15_BRABE|nr:PREDICTED: prolyl endopeptidase-like [Branchiostoma belcheri]